MTVTTSYDVTAVRAHFPALAEGAAHFDGPGGSQTPDAVADAVAGTLNVLGNVYWDQRRLEESRRTQQMALEINREIGKRHAEGTCLNNIGACYQEAG